MTTYSYHGPIQSLSLRIGKDTLKDIQLIPGQPVPKLPMDHPFVKSLIAAKMLRPFVKPSVVEEPSPDEELTEDENPPKGAKLPKGDEPTKGDEPPKGAKS